MTKPIKLKLQCPYCGEIFEVESDNRHPGEFPEEIECMLYTRTMDEYDPDHGDRWTRIGSDFFAKINWESIGILRVENGDTTLDVSYQLVKCPNCGYLSDAYLNWTPDRRFGEIWPHLFGRDENGRIKRYRGLTLTLGALMTLKKRLRSSVAAVALVVLSLFVLSFIPRLLIVFVEHPQMPWQYFWERSAIPLTTRILGSIVLFGLLQRFLYYVQFMHEDQGFYRLFDVQKKDSVTHWLNFTLARTVGVQKPGRYSLSHADIIAGLPSAAVLVFVWMLARLNNASFSPSIPINFIVLVTLVLSGYLLGGWRTLRRARRSVTFESLLFPVFGPRLVGAVFGIVAWGILVVIQMILAEPDQWYWIIDSLFEVIFWGVVAYYIGLGFQFSLNINLYIVVQMLRIPLRLHPLRNFRNLKPLTRVISTVNSILLLEFVLILSIAVLEFIPWQLLGTSLPASHVLGNTIWLFEWVNVGLLLAFAILGVAISPLFPLGMAFYFVLHSFVLPALLQGVPTCTGAVSGICLEMRLGVPVLQIPVSQFVLPFLPTLVLQGVFLSLIVFVNTRRSGNLLVQLRKQAKNRLLTHYEQRIVALSDRITSGEAQVCAENIESLQQLIQLHDHIRSIKVSEYPFRFMTNALSPFLFSVVLPAALQVGMEHFL